MEYINYFFLIDYKAPGVGFEPTRLLKVTGYPAIFPGLRTKMDLRPTRLGDPGI